MEQDFTFDDFLLPQYKKNKTNPTRMVTQDPAKSIQTQTFGQEVKKSIKPSFYHFTNIINVKQFQKRVVKKYDIEIKSPKNVGHKNSIKHMEKNSILTDLRYQNNIKNPEVNIEEQSQQDFSNLNEGKFAYKFEKSSIVLILVNDSIVIEVQDQNRKIESKLGSRQLKTRFLQKYENFLNNPNLDPNYKIQKIQIGYKNFIKQCTKKYNVEDEKVIKINGFEQLGISKLDDTTQFNNQIIDNLIDQNKSLNKSLEMDNISNKEQMSENPNYSQILDNDNDIQDMEKINFQDQNQQQDQQNVLQIQDQNNNQQNQVNQQKVKQVNFLIKEAQNILNQSQLTNTLNQSNSLIDQLLNAQNIFDVDLQQFKQQQFNYPALPKINFKDDEEKRVFEKLFYWLFEIEVELQQGRKMVEEYKLMNGFNGENQNPEQESDQEDSEPDEELYEEIA